MEYLRDMADTIRPEQMEKETDQVGKEGQILDPLLPLCWSPTPTDFCALLVS